MKNTVVTFKEAKQKNEKLSMLTAYDYSTAKIIDEAGINGILVGDSLGMVCLGYEDTLSVTMEDMIHHTSAVTRGAKNTLVVADMPFMSYQTCVYDAVVNAGRLIKEGRAQAVKLEGGIEVCDKIEAIVKASIPVMGHIGLTPQSVNAFGGFKVQGKDEEAAKKLIDEALAIEKAGAFAVVLECVPAKLAAIISEKLSIPTIGIGAGVNCDGQILVYQDMLGVFSDFTPKFVKKYENLGEKMNIAFRKYIEEIKDGVFPAEEHSFKIKIVGKINDVRNQVKEWKKQGLTVGFVPTMGYLHEGHESLIKRAYEENDKVVVSIFVNPMQFGPKEDLASYPRDLKRDSEVCEKAGTDLIFHPENEEMYFNDFSTFVDMNGLTKGLCGKSRPIHFRGVCTVVTKLFNIVAPDRAYFGEKDAQQLAVIKRMVRDLNIDIEIIGCPIIREEDGLAKSSRNTYLSLEERKVATILNKSLKLAKEKIQSGERNAVNIIEVIENNIKSEKLAKIDYIEIVDSNSLEEVKEISKSILVAIAVFIGKTRLIDNFTYEL